MSSLLVEYRKRHCSEAIWTANEGTCFFDIQGRPALIALISLPCRSLSTCYECEQGMLALELFTQGPNRTFNIIYHRHVGPDTNLLNIIREEAGYPQAIPFTAKDNRDVELWLWRFFENSRKPVRVYSAELNPQTKILEEMAQCAIKHPRSYAAYYAHYQAFIIARKYLLYQ